MAASAPRAVNREAVALISGAHLYSHFFILLLPPLFPLLKQDFDISFTQLGLSITVFSAATGLTQAPIGFLVDRIGARPLLIGALVAESLAFVMIGLLPAYATLMAMMVIAGLANAVYHPADYSILNASVSEKHIGKAFSIHTASGFFGGFLAPALVIPLAGWLGWQTAVVICSATGLGMALLLFVRAQALRDASDVGASQAAAANSSGPAGISLLLSLPVMMGLLFYVGLSTFGHGISDFSVSALGEMYDAPLTALGVALSAYLLASPIGVLMGGWIADSIKRHDVFAAVCFVALAGFLFLIAAVQLPLAAIAVALFCAGLLNGVVSPSRDMLIRAMTPPGEMGKVFGFVSTGFNIGGILAPLLFGYLLDRGDPNLVFWVAGIVSLMTVPTVLATGWQGRRSAANQDAERLQAGSKA